MPMSYSLGWTPIVGLVCLSYNLWAKQKVCPKPHLEKSPHQQDRDHPLQIICHNHRPQGWMQTQLAWGHQNWLALPQLLGQGEAGRLSL